MIDADLTKMQPGVEMPPTALIMLTQLASEGTCPV
jgi:hypothetical protein